MDSQPGTNGVPRPNSLAIISTPECSRGRVVSESEVAQDSGVSTGSAPSLEDIATVSPLGSENGDKVSKVSDATCPPKSPADIASALPDKSPSLSKVSSRLYAECASIAGSDETVTEERVLRDQQLCSVEETNGLAKSNDTSEPSSESDSYKSTQSWVTSVRVSLAPTKQIRVISLNQFVPCKRHKLSSEYFCWTCVTDGCQTCMLEKHGKHKVYKSITCYALLQREEVVIGQMDTCLKSLKNVTNRIGYFQATVLCGVINWQKELGFQGDKLTQIQIDFKKHLDGLYAIGVETEGEFILFKRMMSGLRRLYYNNSLIEIHDNSNPIRRSLINLQCLSIRVTQAMTNAVLSETGSRNVLSDIIKTSGMEMLTHTPVSTLEQLDDRWKMWMRGQTSPPFTRSPPDTQAPDIPAALKPLFVGCGVPSPTVSDEFTFAQMGPICRRTPQDGNWPTKQGQVQMAHFDAVSQLLCPASAIWPKVNTPDCTREGTPQPKPSAELCPEPPVQPNANPNRQWAPSTPQPNQSMAELWIPLTPQPQPSNSNNQVAQPLPRCQSLMALREPEFPALQNLQAQRPRQNVRAFEIGYHTMRNYSQIKLPVLQITTGIIDKIPPLPPAELAEYKEKGPNLCRPWGVCCDKKNQIYIADRSHDRIAVFNTDGTFMFSFGYTGKRPGELNRPAGVAIDFQGRAVVADKDNHRIQVFSADGEYLFHFGKYGNRNGEFFYPWDVACSSNGQIAVTDTRNHRVQIFTHSGVFIRKYGWEERPGTWRHFDSPRGLTFVQDNVLLVTEFNNHKIIKITFGDRVYTSQFNQTRNPKGILSRPQGLTVDADGNVLVCDSKNNRIVVFSPRGEFRAEFGKHGKDDGQFDRATDIAIASDGKIAVVDLHNNRVQVF